MKESKIKVLMLEPAKQGKVVEIDNTLEGLQQAVGGLIDIICGPCFICGEDGEDLASLSDELIDVYMDVYGAPHCFELNGLEDA